jgi:hypothetical protein
VVVGRERVGQFLVSIGLVALVASLAVAGATRRYLDSSSVDQAGRHLLEIPSVRNATADEFGRAIVELYAPRPVAADTLSMATARMVQNGDVVDEFERAAGVAHRGWLSGAPLAVELEARVITEAARNSIRDADLPLANAFPSGQLVPIQRIEMPWDTSADTIRRLGRMAWLVALAGLVTFAVGAVLSPRRDRSIKFAARAAVSLGLVLAIAAGLLPRSFVRSIDDRLAVLGSLTAPQIGTLLVVAGFAVFIGFWLHATADRITRALDWRPRDRRTARRAAPVKSGPVAPCRRSGAHRAEAIDAFFGESPPAVIDARDDAVALDGPDESAETTDDDESEDQPEGEAAELTPEEQRAAAAAADRRDALERIDGSKGRLRTHLPR